MQTGIAKSAGRIQAILGDDVRVVESLIFRALPSDRPVLVIASGSVRVDERRVAELLGEKIGRADADFVRDRTGFAIGGVPPVGHRVSPVTYIDESLFSYPLIWAAAGTPNAVFQTTAQDLARLTGGTVTCISNRVDPA